MNNIIQYPWISIKYFLINIKYFLVVIKILLFIVLPFEKSDKKIVFSNLIIFFKSDRKGSVSL
jgi:hypothetical protein